MGNKNFTLQIYKILHAFLENVRNLIKINILKKTASKTDS
ncbi:hypothetical protein ZPR_1575 [Zunongwangia profunda SM-A87]|uniref:Uncharacterized protein n=1 Tax=Zunongwangia profunda (strain DSM 18752 / CCTCC AB 206139 / SM-A87) TaxID=655815 RepID=D5BL11_ZUNPS|nr:hypothetical protein ZPR_1575 [Zunongwangia profunda SM-A87]